MLDPILLNPDNRLLAWSTQDFGLYGGQTPIDLQIGEAKPAPGAPPADVQTAAVGIAQAAPAALATTPVEPGAVVAEAQEPPEATHLSGATAYPGFALDLAALQAPTFLTAAAPAALSVFAPAHPGGTVHAAAPAEAPTSSTGAAEAVASGAPSALAEMAGHVVTKAPLVTDAGAAVHDAIDFLTTTVDMVAQTVTPILDSVTSPVIDAVAELASAPLDAATSGPLAEAVFPLVDDQLGDLLGADPVGGISTLVSLVSISDVFDVSDSGMSEASAPLLVPDLLDTLATDIPLGDALLGDTGHHDDNPLGDLPHADTLGLI
ncbi:hypothetical protein [Sphingomonas sp. LM7]|uniref:hypothetical protein n=1 Tax=Sphingomonas sp. LM7 TaxID=1938607 RepID=UPI000983FF1D|nr:hypothetical protein [Sphingomonas sp. LM7]AQR74414.1 hypothetical protein BXU08_12805 [Sphingomonas sp. LM7]